MRVPVQKYAHATAPVRLVPDRLFLRKPCSPVYQQCSPTRYCKLQGGYCGHYAIRHPAVKIWLEDEEPGRRADGACARPMISTRCMQQARDMHAASTHRRGRAVLLSCCLWNAPLLGSTSEDVGVELLVLVQRIECTEGGVRSCRERVRRLQATKMRIVAHTLARQGGWGGGPRNPHATQVSNERRRRAKPQLSPPTSLCACICGSTRGFRRACTAPAARSASASASASAGPGRSRTMAGG